MKNYFPQGIQGLADSINSGVRGALHRIVGIDYRSKPGIFKAHQKLVKHSPTGSENDVSELCKAAVNLSDGSKLWFSSESGKIWREVDGAYNLVHTLSVDDFDLALVPFKFVVDFSSFVRTFVLSARVEPSEVGVYVEQTFSAFETGESSASSISVDIDILDEPNQLVIVMGGTYTENVAANITGATVGGNAANFLSEIVGFGADGLAVSAKQFSFVSPAPGNNTVTINFSQNYSNRFIAVLVFKNVHQITPVSGFVSGSGNAGVIARFTHTLSQSEYGQGAYTFLITPPATHTLSEDDTVGVTEILNFTNPTVNNRISAFFAEGYEYTSDNKITDAEEFEDEENTFVYFSTKEHLWKVPLENVDLFDGLELAGVFKNGTTEHPMVIQNLSLFIGDKNVMASIDNTGTFNEQTSLNVPKSETITALTSFDIDILIGTSRKNFAKVLRWDTISESWGTEDDVIEDGINAFIKDDNYVYVQAGSYGNLYFYNGEKLQLFKKIPGNWSSTSKVKVHRSSVNFLLGIPLFGLSKFEGNPALLGVYGLGGFNSSYKKTLSLDFPVPTNEFAGVEVGAILVDGADLYLSWKDGEGVGIAKLDWTKKYNGAYMETMLLSGEDRHMLKTFEEVSVPFVSIPNDTDIKISYKKNFEENFTEFTTIKDTQRNLKYSRDSVPKVANPQLRVELETNGNDSPEAEDLLFNLLTPDG